MRHPPWLSRLIFFFSSSWRLRARYTETRAHILAVVSRPMRISALCLSAQPPLKCPIISNWLFSTFFQWGRGGVIYFFFNCGEESRRFFLLHFFNVTFQYCYCRYCRPFEKILCHLTLSSWNWFQFVATEGGLPRFKMLLRGMSTRKK